MDLWQSSFSLESYFVFLRQICRKKWSTSWWFQHHFSKVKHIFDITRFLSYVLYPIRFLSTGNAFFMSSICSCQWWTIAYFFMKSETGKPKLHLDWTTLDNFGNWYSVFVCSHFFEIIAIWLVPSLTQPLSIDFSNFYFAIDHDLWT